MALSGLSVTITWDRGDDLWLRGQKEEKDSFCSDLSISNSIEESFFGTGGGI